MTHRVITGSMHAGREDRFWNDGRLAAFFRERARGGVGLIAWCPAYFPAPLLRFLLFLLR